MPGVRDVNTYSAYVVYLGKTDGFDHPIFSKEEKLPVKGTAFLGLGPARARLIISHFAFWLYFEHRIYEIFINGTSFAL